MCWNEVEEDLFKYLAKSEGNEKNKILLKLEKKIKGLIEYFYLKKYLRTSNYNNKEVLINECYTSIICDKLKYFNPDKGRAYTFIVICIDNYFCGLNKKKNTTVHNNYIELNSDITSESEIESYIEDVVDYLYRRKQEIIEDIKKDDKENKILNNACMMIDILITYFITEKNLDVDELSYYIHKHTELRLNTIQSIIFENKIYIPHIKFLMQKKDYNFIVKKRFRPLQGFSNEMLKYII